MELRELGATHADVGAYLLGLWKLPNPIVEAVSFHQNPPEQFTDSFSLVVAVHVANVFAHDLANNHHEWPGNHISEALEAQPWFKERIADWKRICLEGSEMPATHNTGSKG